MTRTPVEERRGVRRGDEVEVTASCVTGKPLKRTSQRGVVVGFCGNAAMVSFPGVPRRVPVCLGELRVIGRVTT